MSGYKNTGYEVVIGLEVHVELNTATKIFCNCSTEFGAAPNTHVCPVCSGMPGVLPVLNKGVLQRAVAVGLATNCTITQKCKFDRKNYFYPDLPKAFQTSQLYLPICRNGYLEIATAEGAKKVRIHEIHMEEDAGKLNHEAQSGSTLIDFNRCGVPLLEIVSEPDMTCADDVLAYLEKLKSTLEYLNVSDCKMQEGSMRADVNLSVRRVGDAELGTRTETKNMNSLRPLPGPLNMRFSGRLSCWRTAARFCRKPAAGTTSAAWATRCAARRTPTIIAISRSRIWPPSTSATNGWRKFAALFQSCLTKSRPAMWRITSFLIMTRPS